MAQASDMVPAQAYLDQTVDANKAKPGDQFTATRSQVSILRLGGALVDLGKPAKT